MRYSYIFCVTFFAACLPLFSKSQVTVTLHPSQDAVIGFHDNYNSANTNYGTADYYGAFSQPGASGGENAAHSLMQFDLSDIPIDATINSATLDLYGRGAVNNAGEATSVGNIGSNSCYLERVTSAWSYDVVTWNTQPTLTTSNNVLLPQSSNIIQDYLDIDVAGLVQDMVSSPSNSFGFSIRLTTEDPTRGLFFCSTDYPDTSKYPTLTIIYTACTSPTVFTYKVTQDAVIGFHDNYNSANTNYGTADYYGAFSQPGASGGENAAHSLMQFDLSSLPQGIPISSATLDLYGRGAVNNAGDATSEGNIGDNECYIERITTSWNDDVVTWNTQPSVTSSGSTLLPQSSGVIQDYPGIDVTQLVQDMVNDPQNSYGFSIRLVTEDPTRGLFFCSTDYLDSSKHPVLTVSVCGKLSGVENLEESNSGLKIYPNPSSEFSSILLPEYLRNEKVTVIISNIFGEKIKEFEATADTKIELSIGNFNPGIYSVQLIRQEIKTVGLLVVQK